MTLSSPCHKERVRKSSAKRQEKIKYLFINFSTATEEVKDYLQKSKKFPREHKLAGARSVPRPVPAFPVPDRAPSSSAGSSPATVRPVPPSGAASASAAGLSGGRALRDVPGRPRRAPDQKAKAGILPKRRLFLPGSSGLILVLDKKLSKLFIKNCMRRRSVR